MHKPSHERMNAGYVWGTSGRQWIVEWGVLRGGQLERQACVQVTKSLQDQGPWRCGRGCVLGNRYLVMWRLVGGKMEKVRKAVRNYQINPGGWWGWPELHSGWGMGKRILLGEMLCWGRSHWSSSGEAPRAGGPSRWFPRSSCQWKAVLFSERGVQRMPPSVGRSPLRSGWFLYSWFLHCGEFWGSWGGPRWWRSRKSVKSKAVERALGGSSLQIGCKNFIVLSWLGQTGVKLSIDPLSS